MKVGGGSGGGMDKPKRRAHVLAQARASHTPARRGLAVMKQIITYSFFLSFFVFFLFIYFLFFYFLYI
jgi:hypothetical protein